MGLTRSYVSCRSHKLAQLSARMSWQVCLLLACTYFSFSQACLLRNHPLRSKSFRATVAIALSRIGLCPLSSRSLKSGAFLMPTPDLQFTMPRGGNSTSRHSSVKLLILWMRSTTMASCKRSPSSTLLHSFSSRSTGAFCSKHSF